MGYKKTSKHALRRRWRNIVVKNAAELPGIAVQIVHVVPAVVFWHRRRPTARLLQTLSQAT